METAEIGIVGGSGFYNIPELTNTREVRLETPFGDPSDAFLLGELSGKKVAFLHLDHPYGKEPIPLFERSELFERHPGLPEG